MTYTYLPKQFTHTFMHHPAVSNILYQSIYDIPTARYKTNTFLKK